MRINQLRDGVQSKIERMREESRPAEVYALALGLCEDSDELLHEFTSKYKPRPNTAERLASLCAAAADEIENTLRRVTLVGDEAALAAKFAENIKKRATIFSEMAFCILAR